MLSPKRKDPSLYSAVGRAIRDARTRRGLSLRALAAAVGVNPGFLSRIERGTQTPKPELLHLCAKHLQDAELGRLASALSATSSNADMRAEPAPPGNAAERPEEEETASAVEVARKLGIPVPWAETHTAPVDAYAESDRSMGGLRRVRHIPHRTAARSSLQNAANACPGHQVF